MMHLGARKIRLAEFQTSSTKLYFNSLLINWHARLFITQLREVREINNNNRRQKIANLHYVKCMASGSQETYH